jgi:hypothetical protein
MIGHLSWQMGLLLLCLLILAIDCIVGNIAEWRKGRDVIPYRRSRFEVGSDVRRDRWLS